MRRFVSQRRVGAGFDAADQEIVRQLEPGDLVITQDVPLAAAVVEKGAYVIDVRGEVIDKGNARARLAARDTSGYDLYPTHELAGGAIELGFEVQKVMAPPPASILATRQ